MTISCLVGQCHSTAYRIHFFMSLLMILPYILNVPSTTVNAKHWGGYFILSSSLTFLCPVSKTCNFFSNRVLYTSWGGQQRPMVTHSPFEIRSLSLLFAIQGHSIRQSSKSSLFTLHLLEFFLFLCLIFLFSELTFELSTGSQGLRSNNSKWLDREFCGS